MGRGDKRTAKGKTFKGSYGNSRPQGQKAAKTTAAAGAKGKKTAKKS